MIVGAFVGWKHAEERGTVYSILYSRSGTEFLCERAEDDTWMIVAFKDSDGQEYELPEPQEAPPVLEVIEGILDNEERGDEIII